MILCMCIECVVGKCENSSYTKPIFIKTRQWAHIHTSTHPHAHSLLNTTQAYFTNNSEFISFFCWFYYSCCCCYCCLYFVFKWFMVLHGAEALPVFEKDTTNGNDEWANINCAADSFIYRFGWTNCKQYAETNTVENMVYYKTNRMNEQTNIRISMRAKWMNAVDQSMLVHTYGEHLFAKYEKYLQIFPFI